jgi:uncharacterized protein (DUF4213/DUF364 family)
MQLIENLINLIKNDAPVRNVLIGAHWTAVSSRFCGMASTVMSQKPHGEERVRDAGNLHMKSAKELAQYAHSDNPLEASIGLAALNSMIEIPEKGLTKINAFKVVVEKGAGKHVAIFGHFPYLSEVKAIARRISVFELAPIEDEIPFDQVPQVLPDADIVAITSNSIINHTLDSILPYIKPGAYSMLVGPSTPLSPYLFEQGFSLLAGVRILDEELLFQSVGQAAIFRQVQGAELITISRE